LDAAFESPKCALICALAIQTLKKASFLDLPEGLNKTCLNLVNSIWHKGRQCRDADAVLNPGKLLAGWKQDLPLVRPKVLGTYVRILSCEGVHSSEGFAEAVDALCEFVKGGNLHPYVQDAVADAFIGEVLGSLVDPHVQDAVADAFIGEVLGSLVEKDLQRVLQFMEKGAELATRSAAAGEGTQGLWHLDVITERIANRPMSDDLSKRRIVFEAIYKCLNSMHNQLSLRDDETSKGIRRRVEPYLASIIPRVKFRSPRPPRQRSDGCTATVRAVTDRRETKEWTGDVRDLDSQGHGLHIKFHDNVNKCEQVPGSEQLIADTKVQSTELVITERGGSRSRFRQATLKLHLPSNDRPDGFNHETKCDAWAIRGWNYLGRQDEAGALFWFAQEPKELIPYRQNLPRLGGDQIPANSGSVERTPEAAPIRRQFATEDLGLPPFTDLESVLVGIKKWFADWAEDIRVHERWPILWPHGKPTDERSIDSLVRGDLQKYVESRGGHFSVHDSSGLGPVDYSVCSGSNEVVVELKLGHAKWKQGIDAQLASYMKAKKTRYGVFVLFDFEQEFGKDSEHLNDLVKRQRTVCGNEGIRIDIAIISCDKPTPGSKRPTPAREGEGFQWHAGPSPHE
jgi:hypothetical protein